MAIAITFAQLNEKNDYDILQRGEKNISKKIAKPSIQLSASTCVVRSKSKKL